MRNAGIAPLNRWGGQSDNSIDAESNKVMNTEKRIYNYKAYLQIGEHSPGHEAGHCPLRHKMTKYKKKYDGRCS